MANLGDSTVESGTQAPSTQTHANQYTASASGSLTQMFMYCKGNSGAATTYQLGIYADNGSNAPGALLGSSAPTVIPTGQAASWIEMDLTTAVSIASGTKYWVAFSEGGGGAGIAHGTASGYSAGKGSSATLTNPFGTPGWNGVTEIFSVYGVISSGGSVPTNTTAPTVSGSTPYGSTLTCNQGTWANSPSSYAYQWTRNGANIAGATASTYVLGLADLTHAIGCTVTATNATGPSNPVNSSNTITVTAPTPVAAGKLKYAPPPQSGPITLDYTSSPGDQFPTLTAGADYVIKLSPTVPRTGELEIDANGARSVKIIGGLWALNDGGSKNYHIHIHNLMGWAFIEGQEADMANTHADFLCVSGGTLYRPDVYWQNSRILNLTATDATNHADIFQPQGLVGRVYVDKITFSSNYQGFTISADSTGNAPATSVKLSRVNSWFQAANAVNPITYHYWLNGANGSANNDHPPFPLAFDDVWCDLARGAGRNLSGISDVIYPSEFAAGSGKAGGGNYAEGGTSVFTAGESIGAIDSTDGSYAYIANTKMKVGGSLYSGSPATSRSDVITDSDGRGSFVPAGIGSNYSTPGYLPRQSVGLPI